MGSGERADHQLTDADHRESTVDAVLAADTAHTPEPPEVQAARRALREPPVEFDRVLAAIRAGMDPDVTVLTTNQRRCQCPPASSHRHGATEAAKPSQHER